MIFKTLNELSNLGNVIKSIGEIENSTSFIDNLAKATDGLSVRNTILALSTQGVTKEQAELVFIAREVKEEEYKQALANATLSTSQAGATGTTFSLSAAFKGLTASILANIKAMATWMVSNPLGWVILGISAVVTAVAGAVLYFDALIISTEEVQEKLDDVTASFEKVTTEIESLNSELETTRNRIEELNDLDALSLTEEQELEQLKLQNKELERELRIKQELAKIEQQNVNDAARQYFNTGNSNNGNSEFDLIDDFEQKIKRANELQTELAKDEVQELLDKIASGEETNYNEDVYYNTILNYYDELEEINEELASTYSDFIKNDDNITDSEILNDLNEAYEAYDKLLDKAGWTERKISEILAYEGFSEDRTELFALARDGALSTDIIENEYSDIWEKIEALGISVEDFYQYIISESGNAANAVSDIGDAFTFVRKTVSQNISDLNDLKSNLSNIATAFETFKENGSYDISDLDSIADHFLGLEDIDEEIMSSVNEALNTLASPTATLEEQENAIDALADAYLKTSEVFKSLSITNKELMISELEKMGIVNAEEIVVQQLNNKYGDLELQEQFLEEEKKEVIDATADEVVAFLAEVKASEEAIMAIAQFTLEKEKCNGMVIDTSQDVANIISLARAAEVSAAQIAQLTNAQSIMAAAKYDSSLLNTQQYKDAQKIMESLANGTYKFDYKSVEYDPYADVEYSPNVDFEYDGSAFDDINDSASSTAETFDWIETLISRIQRNITNLGKVVSATYRNWSTRNNALAQEMAEVNKEISVQMNAYNAYMAKAESIGLSNEYKALVQSGGYRIDDIADETLKEQISSYKEWYEKALSCSDAIEDLRANLAELAMTKFNNISAQYDDQISVIEHNISMLEGFVSQSEAAGYLASEVYYEAMAEKQEENIAQLQDKYSSLLSAFDEAVKNGSIEKYSEDWYTMLGNINDVEQSLQDATTELIEFNQTLQQLNWEVFDRIQGYVNNITAESEPLVDILDTYNLHTSKGIITEEGLAVQGLHAVNYNVYMEQALAYAEEISKIEEEMAKDPYDMELVDRRNELIGLQQESIANAIQEKEAIRDLIADGYEKMLNSLQEVIDKRKEALQAEKDLYDYHNTIEEKTSNISSLQKQLQAYSSDNSEEAKATIQRLQVSLAEAEQSLAESEYERYLDDQQRLLDDLMTETEQWVNERLDNIDNLVAEAVDATNKNAETISNTLHEVANAYGYKLSEQMESIWNSSNEVVSVYGDILYGVGNDLLISSTNITNAISGGTTSVIDTLNTLNVSMRDTIAAINKMATDNANGIAALQNAIIAGQSSTSIPTTPTTHTPSGGGGSSNSGGTGGGGNKTTDEKYVLLKENGEIIDGGLTWQQAQGMSNAMSGEQKVVKQNSTGETVYDVYDSKTGKQMASGVSLTQAQGMCNAVGSFYYKKRVKTYATGTTNAKRGVGIFGEEGAEILVANDGSVLLANGAQLYPFQGGETVFNAEDTSEILKNSLVPLSIDSVSKNIAPNMNGVIKNTGNNVNQDINVNFELPNVIDANSLIRELQNNKRFEKVIQNMTADRMLGKNSLSKYSI